MRGAPVGGCAVNVRAVVCLPEADSEAMIYCAAYTLHVSDKVKKREKSARTSLPARSFSREVGVRRVGGGWECSRRKWLLRDKRQHLRNEDPRMLLQPHRFFSVTITKGDWLPCCPLSARSMRHCFGLGGDVSVAF